MKEIKPFNRYEVTANDLERIQLAPRDEIKARLKDSMVSPGILVPVDATSTEIEQGLPALFTIAKVGGDTINVAASLSTPSIEVAYDLNGERIEFPSGDAVTGWKGDINNAANDAPRFTTDDVSGFGGLTPFSTGRLNVLDPGGAADTHFVFISYVSVCETVGTPSNHESMNGDITGADDYRKPFTMVDQKLGIAYAYRRTSGYRVFIATTAQITVDGNLVPHLNGVSFPSPEDADTALYVGKYTWNGSSIDTGSEVSGHDASHRRPILALRPTERTKFALANKPPTYADDQDVTLTEHVNAVEELNPHKTRLVDLPDYNPSAAEPQNALWHDDTLGDGITDPTVTTTAPLATLSALRGQIMNSTITIDSIVYDDSVQFEGPTSAGILTTPIYLNGVRYATIGPIVDAGSSNYRAYVTFLSTVETTSGTYAIYVTPHATLANTLTLAKIQIRDSAEGASPLPNTPPDGSMVLCEVYWNVTTKKVRKTRTVSGSDIVPGEAAIETTFRTNDQRVFGVVGMPQLSTQLHADLLRNWPSTTPNLVPNPEFELLKTDVTMEIPFAEWTDFPEWRICTDPTAHGVGLVGTLVGHIAPRNTEGAWTQPPSANFIDFNNVIAGQADEKGFAIAAPNTWSTHDSDTTMLVAEDGPHTNKGLKIYGFYVDGSNKVKAVLQNFHLGSIKPNTTYNISAWVKLGTANTTIGMLARIRQWVATTYVTISGTPEDPTTLQYVALPHALSTDWQLVRTTVTTSDFTPNLATAGSAPYALDIAFVHQRTADTFISASSAISITQVNVTEGPTYIPFIRGSRVWHQETTYSGPYAYGADYQRMAYVVVDSYGQNAIVSYGATLLANSYVMMSASVGIYYGQTVSLLPAALTPLLYSDTHTSGNGRGHCGGSKHVYLPAGRWEFMLLAKSTVSASYPAYFNATQPYRPHLNVTLL